VTSHDKEAAVNDSVPPVGSYPARVEKPWGFEELLHCGEYAIKRLVVRAGQRLSLQYHEEKSETLIVHAGRARINLGEEAGIYGPGQVVHIPAGIVHRIAAEPESDLELFEASTTELADVVRLEDDYGRTNGNMTST
jgi:mannose-6-phosphate isomerase-like protein (cupin superfamily)